MSEIDKVVAVLASMRLMAPWDANAYFDLPIVTSTSVSNAGAVPLIKSNPQRVGLIISSAIATGIALVTPDNSASATKGIAITNASPTIQLTHASFGVLVASEWWGFSTVAGNLTTIELILHRWPPRDRQRDPVPAKTNPNGRRYGR